MELIKIDNDGGKITETNYWETEIAKNNFVFLSINCGVFRLLVPEGKTFDLKEAKTGKTIIISFGPGKIKLMFEILFDDGSEDPYCVFFGSDQADRIPSAPFQTESSRLYPFIVYKKGLVEIMNAMCFYRKVDKIPCLTAWETKV